MKELSDVFITEVSELIGKMIKNKMKDENILRKILDIKPIKDNENGGK